MDLPTRPDDALAQPTRASLFALLGELRRPAGTDELAERLELHPNGVRTHLERLRTARLVERRRTRQARGRPRDTWTIAPDAQPGGDPPSGYRELGRWLARLVSRGRTGRRAVESLGREIGRERRDVVCTLHRGITRGLLDAISPETELTGFVARDPYAAGCLIEVRGGL